MKITFKLLEIASNIYSKPNQLKDLYLLSLTEGFNLKINIYESILNDLSYPINYKGTSQKIKLCLIKGQIYIGIGQISINNKKQTIEIYPDYTKNLSKKIKLTILCKNNGNNNKRNINNKLLKSFDKSSLNTNNFNNCNTNNTSTISMSSLKPTINNKRKTTPVNKTTKRIKTSKNLYRNNSQNNLNASYKNKRFFKGLRKKSDYMHDKIKENKDNITLGSERNKRHLSGNVSLNSFFSEDINKINRKIFSPKVSIYSHPLYKEHINYANNKKKNKNNSIILSNTKKNTYDKIFKYSNYINNAILNSQIDNYIINKSYEDELLNDTPIIYSKEQIDILNDEEFNGSKYEQLLDDFLLLYDQDNMKNININDIKLECQFLIEKIYELMSEYCKEYFYLKNKRSSLINNIKFYEYKTSNILKLGNLLKITSNKTKIKNIMNGNNKSKDNKYYSNNIIKLNKELDILKNINLILMNKNIQKESSKKLLKNLFLIIINKNKSYLNEKQIMSLKLVNIRLDINKQNQNINKSTNYINKTIFNQNNNIKKNIYNTKKGTPLINVNKKSNNSKSKKKANNQAFQNNLYKIKVKTKYSYP